jgi:tetratricopeptide (TPR) repeat protein
MVRATHYSRPVAAHKVTRHHGCLWAAWMCTLLTMTTCLQGVEAAGSNAPADYAKRAYLDAQENLQSDPGNPATAWEFARACFDWAEFATNNAQRAELANSGINAAQAAIKGNTNSAEAHYYLGKNLGQLARTKMLGALPLVDQMETEFKQARALDENLDHAGPDRFLGRLYFEAPALASIGSRAKARLHFDRAAELAPDYPENRLNQIEAAIRWGERDAARRELDSLERKLPQARARFHGETWAAAWLDWNQRLEAARTALRKTASRPVPAGRGGSLFN